MAEGKQYRTVLGAIQFDPKDSEAGGKAVRNITVQQNGFGPTAVRVSATVWGNSHGHVALKKGDVVLIEGPYTKNKQVKDDGTEVTYHNLSVNRLSLLGTVDEGTRDGVGTVNTPADDTNDEDIPF